MIERAREARDHCCVRQIPAEKATKVSDKKKRQGNNLHSVFQRNRPPYETTIISIW